MTKPSAQIAEQISALENFRDLFRRFCDTEQEDEQLRLFDEVSLAAGRAMNAYAANNGRLFALNKGILLIPDANPLNHWASVFDHDSGLSIGDVITAVNQTIGRAQDRRDAAVKNERGLIGLVAAFLRWPAALREAVGPSRAQRRAAQTLGIAGQLIVSVVSGVLVAVLVRLLFNLWELVSF